MIWCFLGGALVCMLLALAIATLHRPRWSTLRMMPPGVVLRGCLVLPLVILALVLVGIAAAILLGGAG